MPQGCCSWPHSLFAVWWGMIWFVLFLIFASHLRQRVEKQSYSVFSISSSQRKSKVFVFLQYHYAWRGVTFIFKRNVYFWKNINFSFSTDMWKRCPVPFSSTWQYSNFVSEWISIKLMRRTETFTTFLIVQEITTHFSSTSLVTTVFFVQKQSKIRVRSGAKLFWQVHFFYLLGIYYS